MWKNKASRLEETAHDAPRAAAGETDSAVEIHAMKEGQSGGSSAPLARPAYATESAPSRLGARLCIKGEVKGTGDLIVEGAVEGTIQLEGHKLTIGTGAKIVADIQAGEIVVYGEIRGNLHARDRIEIRKEGAVHAELTTSRIVIDDGAYFKGSIEIERYGAALDQRPEVRPREAEARARREIETPVVPTHTGGTPTLHPPSFADPASVKNVR